MEGGPFPHGNSLTHLMSLLSPWTTSLKKESMEVACLLLNCLPPHVRTSHVITVVVKEAGKWSSWPGWLPPSYSSVLYREDGFLLGSWLSLPQTWWPLGSLLLSGSKSKFSLVNLKVNMVMLDLQWLPAPQDNPHQIYWVNSYIPGP